MNFADETIDWKGYIILKLKTIMKKTLAILAVLALTSCGNGANKETTTDSTAAQVDSSAISATDSTTAQIPTDSTEKK